MYADEVAQCPECGTTRLVIRRKRDHIDRYRGGLVAWWRRKMGGRLYHCIFCRLQFYSTLPLAADVLVREREEQAEQPSATVDTHALDQSS